MNDSEKKLLTTIRFEGPRFDDHGLDVDVLSEIAAYKKLVMETAKEVWRSENPDRERLPRRFEESFSVKIYSINPGSVAVDLTRTKVPSEEQMEIPFEEEEDSFDKSAVLVEDAVTAMSSDAQLPEKFPANVIPLFKDLGATLRDDESINAQSPSRATPSRYTCEVRQKFIDWQEPRYEDDINIIGEVRKADLDGGSFSIKLPDAKKVEGKFSPDQEKLLINALQEHDSTRLQIVGTGMFDRQSGALQKIVSVEQLTPVPAAGIGFDDRERPIWEIVQEIGEEVSDEEWSKVPSDLATNLDHYLYGANKSEP